SPSRESNTHPFRVLFVGSYRRNFTLLRKVCVSLQSFSDIKIDIIAPSNLVPGFGDIRNVTVISGVGDDELRGLYRRSSCLLMTAEGATANNAVLEAMACGVPIVSERIGGIPEYTGEESSILCPPGSAEALTQAILRLREHRDLSVGLAVSGRRRAE